MLPIPTSNILKPGAIAGQANLALVTQLQLLTPQFYKKYAEKYGAEDFTWWLNAYSGMEEVNNDEFFWFENRGKLMIAITNVNEIVAPAAGATVQVQLAVEDHYNNGTQTPLRIGETVRIASSNIEGVILTIPDTTPNAFQFTVRPKQSTQAFVSGGSANLLAGEVLLFGGNMDVGEASDSIEALQHLDQKYTNTCTQMRESWAATDLGGMTEVFYTDGATGISLAGGEQAGYSYFTYKELIKSNQRFANNVEFKLMRGDIQNNTGLLTTTSQGSQGIIPKIQEDGETVTYTPGNLDIAKIHEINNVMDVNGCAKQCLWLMDMSQRQDFNDSIFAAYPAGAWVWGDNEKSEEAAINYGVKSINIDGRLFQVKKYPQFNTPYVFGKTPTNDIYEDFGIICPMGDAPMAKGNGGRNLKNISIMYRKPTGGGTIGNGIRVWQHGGGSRNPTNGKMEDKIEQITYRGTRMVNANQFLTIQKP
jgi:hypothetical protein